MKTSARALRCLALGLAGLTAAGLLYSEVQPGTKQLASDLGGEHRYRAHPRTDRPVYRPGETVYLSAAVLDAATRAPLQQVGEGLAFKIKSPRGDAVVAGHTFVSDGTLGFNWAIPAAQAGGDYTAVFELGRFGPPAEIAFSVRSYRAPRLRTDLQFLRKAYGPGDEVSATLTATRSEGGIPVGAKVTAVATVDGAEAHRSTLALDEKGALSVKFSLPKEISAGNGTLALVIEDGGVQETAARSIPIVLAKIALSTYAEGGELVAGLPARVYVEARSFKGLPADVAGRVLDGKGTEVARFRTRHEGRGRFEFTPAEGGEYAIAVDEPTGIADRFKLAAVQAAGVSLISRDDVVEAGQPVRVKVAASADAPVKVVLAQMEREVARQSVELKAKQTTEVSLEPVGDADGVLRVTVLNGRGVPRAERLVFRRPARGLKIQVTATPERTVPGGQAQVKVKCTDADGRPVSATVMVNVVDDAVLETIEKRDRAPRLPVQVLLGSDVRELADAHVYLGDGADAASSLDLLLGTQGWRRFAYRDLEAFLRQHGDAAKRAVAKADPPQRVEVDDQGAVIGMVENQVVRVARPQAIRARGMRAAMAVEKNAEMLAPPPPPAAPTPMAPAAAPMDAPAQEAAQDGDMEMGNERAAGKLMAPAPALAEARDAMQEMAAQKELNDEFAGGAGGAPAPARARAFLRDARRGRRTFQDRVAAEPPMVGAVREYAHAAGARQAGRRADFAETLYWNVGLTTNAQGEATCAFALSDSVTTFRVRADAFAADGALGDGDATVEARRPFYAEAKLPLVLTSGDKALVPVALVNSTSNALSASLGLELGAGLKVANPPSDRIALGAEARVRTLVELTAEPVRGEASVRVRASAGPLADDVARSIPIEPAGFPMEHAFGGRLEGKVAHDLAMPGDIEPTSLLAEAIVYPSPVASLTQAVSALLREPSGCFEQTSSSNYPNVMVMQYLKTHRVEEPALLKRCQELMDSGYRKLTGYECKENGYEWFGGDPGHEALTAYGVLEFTDMKQVYPVDDGMLTRTSAWLLSRRDGNGGFQRNPKALDSFGSAAPDITDAYIVWAVAEAGTPGIEKELATLKERAGQSDDPYLIALAAAALTKVKDPSAAALCEKLAQKQSKEGHLTGTRSSITGSGGESLSIETTALASLAWLRVPERTANVDLAMRWMLERSQSGRFGSTQATILALRAITAYDEATAGPRKPGTLLISIDGKVVDEKPFGADAQGPIAFPKFADKLTPGQHKVELSMVGGAPMPYSLKVRYHTHRPASSANCRVGISTALASAKITEGEAVDLSITVTNKTKAGLPMTLAVVGLPAGLETRADQLKELVKSGRIDFYELRGRELVLYWRGFAPNDKRSVVVSLLAAIPGTYTGPASRAYLYYSDEDKQWADPLKAEVSPR